MQTKNICVNILRKTEKQYYSNLEVRKVLDNKKFRKTVKNFFSDKSNNFETITLVKNNLVISDNQKIANIFIKYSDTIVPKLGLAIPGCHICYKWYSGPCSQSST